MALGNRAGNGQSQAAAVLVHRQGRNAQKALTHAGPGLRWHAGTVVANPQ